MCEYCNQGISRIDGTFACRYCGISTQNEPNVCDKCKKLHFSVGTQPLSGEASVASATASLPGFSDYAKPSEDESRDESSAGLTQRAGSTPAREDSASVHSCRISSSTGAHIHKDARAVPCTEDMISVPPKGVCENQFYDFCDWMHKNHKEIYVGFYEDWLKQKEMRGVRE